MDVTDPFFDAVSFPVVEAGEVLGLQKQIRFGLYPSNFIAFARETNRTAYSIVSWPSESGLAKTMATSLRIKRSDFLRVFVEDNAADADEMIDLVVLVRSLLCF